MYAQHLSGWPLEGRPVFDGPVNQIRVIAVLEYHSASLHFIPQRDWTTCFRDVSSQLLEVGGAEVGDQTVAEVGH